MGRLVGVEPNSRPAVLEGLLGALAVEKAAAPLASVVAALGHVGDAGTLGRIFPLADDPNPEVRLAVAFAVATISPPAIPASPAASPLTPRTSTSPTPERGP